MQAAVMPEVSKKRKAECCADDTAEPETKRGKTLYETTIAAPFRRARRSLGCMQKVHQSIQICVDNQLSQVMRVSQVEHGNADNCPGQHSGASANMGAGHSSACGSGVPPKDVSS